MSRLKYPLLVWEDHDGAFTARTLGGATAAATAATARKAVDQIRRGLRRRARTEAFIERPDFEEPELVDFRVSVRPAYEAGSDTRQYDRPVTLRIPAVVGRCEDDSLTCLLPTLDAALRCETRTQVDSAAPDHARRQLDGLEPRTLSRFLPSRRYWLDAVFVAAPRRRGRPAPPDLPNLRMIAEPLGRSTRPQPAAVWQREREVAAVAGHLQGERANLLLVGDNGTGKSAVLGAAVREVERKPRPESADDPASAPAPRERFWRTSGARIVAGMQYLGQWEERCEEVIEELDAIAGVLCVENLLELVRMGGSGPSSSIATFLAPYVEHGELRLVAEATPAELDACRRLLPGFASLFRVVRIDPFDDGAAHQVLAEVATAAQKASRVDCAAGVAGAVRRLFGRFLPYHAFPGRSVRFLREAIAKAARDGAPEVTVDHVVEAFLRQTGLPEFLLRDELPLEAADVRRHFEGRICGQPAACDAVTRVVTTFKAGLNDPRRPLGVLLFCGPTGVGKTALAAALGDYLFGHGDGGDRLVRLDMSEFAGPGAARRLLRQPDGEPSALIRRIRAQPFSVVLLDEIEKAGADVFDMLLGMFDEGRLTDEYGRVAIFRSAVIIMTSNLGAGAMRPIGLQRDAAPAYASEAYAFFRPEFFNRIDEVVTFNALDADAMLAITRKELEAIARRDGLVKAGLRLQWSEALVRHLAERGFDARYGARSLQRTITQEVTSPLSRWLVGHAGLRDVAVYLDIGEEGRVQCAAREGRPSRV